MNDSLHDVTALGNVPVLSLQKVIRLISHIALQALNLSDFIKLMITMLLNSLPWSGAPLK